jgi:hypothetical protein
MIFALQLAVKPAYHNIRRAFRHPLCFLLGRLLVRSLPLVAWMEGNAPPCGWVALAQLIKKGYLFGGLGRARPTV